MRTWIIFLLFSCSLTISWSQSIMETRELTISNSFDNLTVQSYAVQGELKVQELMEYLRLVSVKTNTVELNKQLAANMEQLFSESEVQLFGIENKQPVYTVAQWLEDWKNAHAEVVSMKLINSELKNTFWIYTYQLNYTINGKQKATKMKVNVNFQPQTKTFGTTKKEVWELKINKIDFN